MRIILALAFTVLVVGIYLFINNGVVQNLSYYQDRNDYISHKIGHSVDSVIKLMHEKLQDHNNKREGDKIRIALAKLEWELGYTEQAFVELNSVIDQDTRTKIAPCIIDKIGKINYRQCALVLYNFKIDKLHYG